MKVKLEDVAKAAGVSPTTVSRVLNSRGYISEVTNQHRRIGFLFFKLP